MRSTDQLSHRLHISPSPLIFLSSLHLAITVISASVIGSDMGLHVNVWLLQSEKLKVCLCVCITVRTCAMGDKAE